MSLFRRSPSMTTEQVAASLGASAPRTPQRTVNLVKGSGAAVDRAQVESQGGVDLTKKFDKAGLSLSKRGLTGIRAEVVLYLDFSGSMRGDYQSGLVQKLVDRTLGYALQVDGDGVIPVYRFGSRLESPVDVTIANHTTISRDLARGSMGYTNLASALEHLLTQAREAEKIVYAVVITDGDPYVPGDQHQRERCTRLVKELAAYPVFLKFLSLGQVDYLDALDDIPASERLIDNCDAKAIPDPAGIADLAFADLMADEFDTWIASAQRAGIVL